MNTKIIVGIIAGVVIVGGGALLMKGNKENNNVAQTDSACAEVCGQASQTCPSLINEGSCNNKCAKLSEETKKHLQESTSCEQITSKPDLIAELLIPDVATPKPVEKNASECEAACGSYVSKCLTLVPNATAALFEEGQSSCEAECAGWSISKVDCMVTVFDCEAMTNVCGL
jgi:hypothetical protein